MQFNRKFKIQRHFSDAPIGPQGHLAVAATKVSGLAREHMGSMEEKALLPSFKEHGISAHSKPSMCGMTLDFQELNYLLSNLVPYADCVGMLTIILSCSDL